MNAKRSGRLVSLLAVAAASLLLVVGCAEWNDNPAPGMKVELSFQGMSPSTDGLIESPHNSIGNTDPVLSIAVGAIVISRSTPWTSADAADFTPAERDELTDDAIQSADFLTIEDLPFSGDSISFLIPPETSGNWQLVAVGSRDNIDVLDDFDGNDDAPIWYAFSDTFLNGLVQPGSQIAIELVPACGANFEFPPDTRGDGIGACP